MQGFRLSPSNVRRKSGDALEEAGDTLADGVVDVECDEEAHKTASSSWLLAPGHVNVLVRS
jgi:hypothetical protein